MPPVVVDGSNSIVVNPELAPLLSVTCLPTTEGWKTDLT